MTRRGRSVRGLAPLLTALLLAGSLVGGCAPQQTTTTPEVTSTQTPTNTELQQHLFLGDQYRQSALYDKAIEEYDKALAIDPENDDAYARKGFTLLDKEEFDAAVKMFRRVVSLRPKDCNAHSRLAFAYLKQGLAEQAVRSYEEALQFCADDPNTYMQLAKAYLTGDNPIEAMEAYRRAIELNPGDIRAYEYLGQLYFDRRLFPEAIAIYEAIINHADHGKDPGWIGWANGRIAWMYKWGGSHAAAVPFYREALAVDVGNVRYSLGLAECYENTGQMGPAVTIYEQLIEAAPEKPLYYYRLGELLNDSGRYAEAITRVKKGLSVDMACSAQAHCVLGKAYEKLKQYDRARREFEDALMCNDRRYNDYATKQIDRQAQLIKIEELKAQKEKYGY